MHCFDSVVLLLKLGKNVNFSRVFSEIPVPFINRTAVFLNAPALNDVLLVFP